MAREDRLTLDMLVHLAARFGAASKVARELPGWLEAVIDVDCPERPPRGSAAAWWANVRTLVRGATVAEDAGGDGALIERNCAFLGQHFRLSATEVRILAFVGLYRHVDGFETLVDAALETREASLPMLLGWFCAADEAEVRALLRPSGRLAQSGLLFPRTRSRLGRLVLDMSDRLAATLLADVDDLEDLIGRLFERASEPEALWSDFAGMAEEAALCEALLVQALQRRLPGVNILLYGPTGTGKTEFAKVLARKVGAELRTICTADPEGGEPGRGERQAELALAGRMLGSRTDTVLLFDEMEDLLPAGAAFFRSDRPSKVHFNRLLETNPLPVIWTTNTIDSCDTAFLRRMSYAVAMRVPSGFVRERIWQRLDAREGMGLPAPLLADLARNHDLPPASVASALRLSKACDGGAPMVGRMLASAARLANGGLDPAPAQGHGSGWIPALARTDTPLALIEARMADLGGSRPVSFCLEGPAGTGKSAWARHLARCMNLPVIEKRASDLVSKWLGESERNIALAFAEARSAGAVLIFDEADSLLADRAGARHRWEVSQVNEMLTWMESHPLPFLCTTNAAERLDPATQRRFTFRIRFDPLDAAGIAAAWSAYFHAPAPDLLPPLTGLTAGDFANVARRLAVLGSATSEAILQELHREDRAKPGHSRPVGFGR